MDDIELALQKAILFGINRGAGISLSGAITSRIEVAANDN